MRQLSYDMLKQINYDGYLLENAPEKVLQFGEGNFMRGFVDYFIDVMNEKSGFNSKVVVCQPIEQGLAEIINEQEGLYTLYLNGLEKEEKIQTKRVISCISRCIDPYTDFESLMDLAKNEELKFITCNTTEAGIVFDPKCKFTDRPPSSFPGKLTRFLYERYHANQEGFIILSCELINQNGKELEKCVKKYADLWGLEEEFKNWIRNNNHFCSTLVDRIVTGYPKKEAQQLCDELGYVDKLLNTAETFGLWVIEGPSKIEELLPFKDSKLPIIVTKNHTPYKERKVRILNGAHTTLALGAFLGGKEIVRDCMNDHITRNFMNKIIYEEVIPVLELPTKELEDFALSIQDRFSNPYINHELISISLNSTAKWKSRVLPTLKMYLEKRNELPKCIVASLAFYIEFYRGDSMDNNILMAKRGNEPYKIIDDLEILEFFITLKDKSEEEIVSLVLENKRLFDEDLSKIIDLEKLVLEYLIVIKEKGPIELMKKLVQE